MREREQVKEECNWGACGGVKRKLMSVFRYRMIGKQREGSLRAG
jgi:hypothetical protein